jgi:hypothetical protein
MAAFFVFFSFTSERAPAASRQPPIHCFVDGRMAKTTIFRRKIKESWKMGCEREEEGEGNVDWGEKSLSY